MNNFFFFISICILLISCEKKTQNNKNIDLIFIPQDKITTVEEITFDNDRFIDSCVFTPLETSESGLIGEVTQIETYNDKYYIFDKKTNCLKVFDSIGKYLFDIGKKGEGPGEYLSINSFFINKKENKIGIFDPLRKAVHEYNLNGKFLQTVKHNQNKLIGIEKSIWMDDYICCSSESSHNNDMAYSIISSKDYSIIDRWSPYPVKINMNMGATLMKNPFCLVDGDLHYTSLYTDTIYSYNKGKKQPYLLIETGKSNIPSTYFEGKPFEHDPMGAHIAVWQDKKYSPGFNNIFETDRFILVGFKLNNDFYIVDKVNMEVTHVENKCFPHFGEPTLINGNNLIEVFDSQNISSYQDYIKYNNLEYPEQIRELMSKYDVDEDNPILIIYHMKKSEK